MPDEENIPNQSAQPQGVPEPVISPMPRERTTIDTRPGYDTLGSPLHIETKQAE